MKLNMNRTTALGYSLADRLEWQRFDEACGIKQAPKRSTSKKTTYALKVRDTNLIADYATANGADFWSLLNRFGDRRGLGKREAQALRSEAVSMFGSCECYCEQTREDLA
jgi:hypothetical protein